LKTPAPPGRQSDLQTLLAAVHESLDSDELRGAWSAGENMTLTDAVNEVMGSGL